MEQEVKFTYQQVKMKAINKNGEKIEFNGKSIEEFERLEMIDEIILIGSKGGIKRIILE